MQKYVFNGEILTKLFKRNQDMATLIRPFEARAHLQSDLLPQMHFVFLSFFLSFLFLAWVAN
jgi:hypothetical protein